MEKSNQKRQKIVFLTGAGMSVESGFKTFRGNDGLWENYPVERVATHEAWVTDPDFVTEFYNRLRKKLYAAQPNKGHKLIKELERDYDVTVVTQNVDNLHEKAGSTHVIHLHGELAKVCSSADPDDPRYIRELPEDDCQVAPGTRAGDGSLLRPYIVFFRRGGAQDWRGSRGGGTGRHAGHHRHVTQRLSRRGTGAVCAPWHPYLSHRPRTCSGPRHT